MTRIAYSASLALWLLSGCGGDSACPSDIATTAFSVEQVAATQTTNTTAQTRSSDPREIIEEGCQVQDNGGDPNCQFNDRFCQN